MKLNKLQTEETKESHTLSNCWKLVIRENLISLAGGKKRLITKEQSKNDNKFFYSETVRSEDNKTVFLSTERKC